MTNIGPKRPRCTERLASRRKPAHNQDATPALSFPTDDEADHHRQHGGEQQVRGDGLGKRVADALANGYGGDQWQEEGSLRLFSRWWSSG
jgi:hypothetical protein